MGIIKNEFCSLGEVLNIHHISTFIHLICINSYSSETVTAFSDFVLDQKSVHVPVCKIGLTKLRKYQKLSTSRYISNNTHNIHSTYTRAVHKFCSTEEMKSSALFLLPSLYKNKNVTVNIIKN